MGGLSPSHVEGHGLTIWPFWVCFVCRGNSGIGLISAAKLAAKDYEVVLACRDLSKAEDAKRKVQAIVPGSTVSTVRLDLANLSSVSECASQLLDQEPFDVLLNNAGKLNSS